MPTDTSPGFYQRMDNRIRELEAELAAHASRWTAVQALVADIVAYLHGHRTGAVSEGADLLQRCESLLSAAGAPQETKK